MTFIMFLTSFKSEVLIGLCYFSDSILWRADINDETVWVLITRVNSIHILPWHFHFSIFLTASWWSSIFRYLTVLCQLTEWYRSSLEGMINYHDKSNSLNSCNLRPGDIESLFHQAALFRKCRYFLHCRVGILCFSG